MSHRTDTVVREITQALIPGQPVLVTGNRDCGKVAFTKMAIKNLELQEKHLDCSVLDLLDFRDGMFLAGTVPGTNAVILDDIDGLENSDKALVAQVRHFMALSSRTIVLIANNPDGIHPDILAQVVRRVHVPDATDEDIREWVESTRKNP